MTNYKEELEQEKLRTAKAIEAKDIEIDRLNKKITTLMTALTSIHSMSYDTLRKVEQQ